MKVLAYRTISAIEKSHSYDVFFLSLSMIWSTFTITLFRLSLPEVGASNNIATAPTAAPHKAPDQKLIVRIFILLCNYCLLEYNTWQLTGKLSTYHQLRLAIMIN